MPSGNYGSSGVGTSGFSEDGILFNSDGVQIGTVWAQDDGDGITYINGFGQVFVPDFANGEYVAWADGGQPVAPIPTRLCYHMKKALSEPIGGTYNVANKGYLIQNIWLEDQIENAGNTGSSDIAFNTNVKLDPYGIPVGDGDVVTTDSQTFTSNETTAYGKVASAEGLIYSPVMYGGNPVTSFMLLNDEADTDRADYDQLYISMDNANTYTLDHQDLKLVMDKPLAGSDSTFEFDPAQRGVWARFYMFHSDLGGDSEYQWLVKIVTDNDGTPVTTIRPLAEFIHKPDVALIGHANIVQSVVINDVETGEWTEGGSSITAPLTTLLQQVVCGTLPIDGIAYLLDDTITISNASGGSGAPYTYSIDGGRTTQASPVFTLPLSRNVEILPVILDSNGTKSGYIDPNTFSHCVAYSNQADIAGIPLNDNRTDDGSLSGTYSRIVVENAEESDTPVTWTYDVGVNDTSYGYLGKASTVLDDSAVGDLAGVLDTTISGKPYAFKYNLYHYYKGLNGALQNITVKVVDKTTGNILGSATTAVGTNYAFGKNDIPVNFVGTGNPVEIVVESKATTDFLGGIFLGESENFAYHEGQFTTNNPSSDWFPRMRSNTSCARADAPSMSFTIDNTTNYLMFGLMPKDTQMNNTYIGTQSLGATGGYTVYFPNGTGIILYNLSWDGATQSCAAGDNFELSMDTSGVVHLYKNGDQVATGNQPAIQDDYEVQLSLYLTGRQFSNFVWNGSDTIDDAGWWGRRQYNRNDNGKIRNLYTGNSWDLPIMSPTGLDVADVPSFKFKWADNGGTGTPGMAGLSNTNYTGTSYSGIQYAIYDSDPDGSSSNIRVYENGAVKGTYSFPSTNSTPNVVFEVRIKQVGTDQVVEYLRDNVVFHTTTSTMPAQTKYYVRVNPYTVRTGVDVVSWNGDIPVEDFLTGNSTGYYDRIDAFGVYEGAISTSVSYSKKVSTYLLTRNIVGTETWLWDAHIVDPDEEQMVIPRVRVVPYGTAQETDTIEYQYKVGNGAWTTMFNVEGPFDVANKLDLDVYEYRAGVLVPANTEFSTRIIINMDESTVNRGYYIYEIAEQAQCR